MKCAAALLCGACLSVTFDRWGLLPSVVLFFAALDMVILDHVKDREEEERKRNELLAELRRKGLFV